jgi:branched-chain amino acid aminotransferase
MKIWLDGKLCSRDEAKISIFDHCVLYGDGVFEGIRVYDGCIFRLRQHLDRLWSSAKYIRLTIPMTKEEMTAALVETVRANELRSGYIRLVVTRGDGDLGLDPRKCPKASVFIIATQIGLYPVEAYEKGMAIITATTRRLNTTAFNPRVKSCNYINNVMAKIECIDADAPEALMLDNNGFVVEATADNVFLVKNGVITTPPAWLGALRGITRDAIIELAISDGLEVREEPFTLYEVYDADEMFLTGTAAEAVPITAVDGRVIGEGTPGPITRSLISRFKAITSTDGVAVYEEAQVR